MLKRTMLLTFVMSAIFMLSGCQAAEDGYVGKTANIISNQETLNSFVKMMLTDTAYVEYTKALAEQEKRSHYIDIEDVYRQSELSFYADYTTALNLGIIDGSGNKTGVVNQLIFAVESMSKENMLMQAKGFESKEKLIGWLTALNFLTEGAELEGEDVHKYPDVLLSKLEVIPGEIVGFTKEELAVATQQDIVNWVGKFYTYEKSQVDKYRVKNKLLNGEELANRVAELLTHEYETGKVFTDGFISVIDNRHVITENTINMLGMSGHIPVHIKGRVVSVDVYQLGKKVEYGENYACALSDDKKSMELLVSVNGEDLVIISTIDPLTGELNMSTYDIYRLLGMKVYV